MKEILDYPKEYFLCLRTIPEILDCSGQLVTYSRLIDHLFILFSLNDGIDISHAPETENRSVKELLLKVKGRNLLPTVQKCFSRKRHETLANMLRWRYKPCVHVHLLDCSFFFVDACTVNNICNAENTNLVSITSLV